MRRSPNPASAGTSPRTGPPGGTGRPAAARTPPTSPGARSTGTLGKTYTAPDGTTFRPSMFITLTCPSYGRVDHRGVPVDPAAYDYDQASRAALTFAALFDPLMAWRPWLHLRQSVPSVSSSLDDCPSPGRWHTAAAWVHRASSRDTLPAIRF
jgi:hypothetical protein